MSHLAAMTPIIPTTNLLTKHIYQKKIILLQSNSHHLLFDVDRDKSLHISPSIYNSNVIASDRPEAVSGG